MEIVRGVEADFDISVALERLGVNAAHVSAAYCVGSRLWGTAKHSSDTDLLIVLKAASGTSSACRGGAGAGGGRVASREPCRNTHAPNIDAWVLEYDAFREAVRAHRMLELMCLWAPATNILIAPSVAGELSSKTFTKLDLPALYKSTSETCTRDWQKAEKDALKGNVAKAEKILIHRLRNLMLANQLAANGSIDDFGCANEWIRDIWEEKLTWKQLEERFKEQSDALEATLRLRCKIPKNKGAI